MSPSPKRKDLAAPWAATALLVALPLTFDPALLHAEAAPGETRTEAAKTGEWPQFRGPDGDGIVADGSFAERWLEGGLEVAWRRPLGSGFSGITAAGGRLYTLAGDGGEEYLFALDAATGERLWRLRTDAERRDQFGDGPRSTPTVNGDSVFAVSALGTLWAADRATGEARWHRDLKKDFGATVPTWGVSATPVIEGGLLLMNVGGKPGHAVMAFDPATGEVRWHAESGLPGYSLPITFTAQGRRQTVFFLGRGVLSLDPSSGEKLWDRPWKTAYDVNAAAPIFIPPNRLFVSSGYDTGASLFAIETTDEGLAVREVWRSRRLKNQFSSSVYREGFLYGFDNKTLKCVDAATGEDVWRTGGFGHGSLFLLGDHLVVLSDRGKLALVEATPEDYRELATVPVAEGKHWTVPTYYDGRLYVRNERELLALEPAASGGGDDSASDRRETGGPR